jgi:hypothetical protein
MRVRRALARPERRRSAGGVVAGRRLALGNDHTCGARQFGGDRSPAPPAQPMRKSQALMPRQCSVLGRRQGIARRRAVALLSLKA